MSRKIGEKNREKSGQEKSGHPRFYLFFLFNLFMFYRRFCAWRTAARVPGRLKREGCIFSYIVEYHQMIKFIVRSGAA